MSFLAFQRGNILSLFKISDITLFCDIDLNHSFTSSRKNLERKEIKL